MARGVDLSGGRPKGYGQLHSAFELVVSVCDRAREAGPPFDSPMLHWSVPDPVASGKLSAFRSAFADIDRRLDRLAGSAGTGR